MLCFMYLENQYIKKDFPRVLSPSVKNLKNGRTAFAGTKNCCAI